MIGDKIQDEVLTENVLVECVKLTRTRYIVKVPKGHSNWALDSVVMKEAELHSSKDLEEVIVSHRVIEIQEIIE